MRATVATLLVLMCAVLLLTGCPKPQPAEQGEVLPAPTDEQPAGDATPTEPTTAPGEFAWTETPTLDMIPEGNIAGMINGEEFSAQTVRLKQDEENTVLEISNVSVDGPTGLTTDDTGLDLRFTLTPGQPGEFVIAMADEKDFEKQHAYYHYPQGGDKGPMSVNPSWACALQISEWTLETNTENEELLGGAKGKVAVVFGDDAKSWVAGTFDCIYYKW